MQNKIIRLLLFTVLAFVFATESSAQGGFTRPNTIYGTRMYRLGIDSAFFFPTFCGAPSSLRSSDLKQAMLYYDSCNAAMYVRNPKTNTWAQLSAAADELYILNQFATKENKAFNIRSGRLDSLYAAGSGGLHFVNNGGTTAFEYGAGGGTQVTFNGFAGYNANRAASYTARSFTDKNYVDSAIAAGGSGGPTYTAGNGIKIEGDSTIRLADSLTATNTEIRVPYDEGAETFAVNGYRNGMAETVGILVSPLQQRVSLIGADAIGGTSATIQVNSSGTISMIGRPMNLIIDSIRLIQTGSGIAYQARPAPGTIGKYRVALMDAGSGALVTVARDSAGYIINPMTTAGDLIVGGASGAAGRLGIGSTGQVLTVSGGTAAWATPSSYPRDSVGVRRINQGSFDHYVGFNSGVGGTGTSGGNVKTAVANAGDNFAIGQDAGFSFTTSGNQFDGNNILLGKSSGKWITNSGYNVGLGFQTLGGANSTITDSLFTSTSGGSHIAIGFQALSKIRGGDLQNSQVAIGRGAMQNYTSCSGCTNSQVAIGTNALNASTTSQKNTAVGGGALSSVTTNGDNTAVGFNSLGSNTGQSNTAVGSQALQNHTSQQGSTAVGFNAGVSSTGGFNSFFGWASGGNLSVSGNFNTSVGAGNVVGTTGSDNVSIGYSIGVLSNTASNQFALGSSSVRWLVSDVSGSHRRWTLNGTTTDVTANTASVTLDITGTSGGVRFPRLTTTQRDALTATEALLVYNTSMAQLNYRDGSTWQAQVGMTFGTAAPTSTPTAVGNFFLDTSNKKLYVATGTSSSADWNILN